MLLRVSTENLSSKLDCPQTTHHKLVICVLGGLCCYSVVLVMLANSLCDISLMASPLKLPALYANSTEDHREPDQQTQTKKLKKHRVGRKPRKLLLS